MHRLLTALAAVFFTMSLVVAPPAATAPTWLSPEGLSALGQSASFPKVAVDSGGNAIVVWRRSNGANTIVQAGRYDAATNSWGAAIDLSAPGQNVFSPTITIDPGGNAIVVWARSNGANLIVQAARYDAATNSWGAATDLSAAGQSAGDPDVAIDPAGNAIAVWSRFDGANTIVQSARYDGAAGAWGAAADLSAAGQNAGDPDVAIDPAGNAIAVWVRSNGANQIVQAARYDAGAGAWAAPENLSAAGQNAAQPQGALDSAGNAIAVWQRSDGANQIIQAARYAAATDSWSAATDLSAPGQNAALPQAAVDGPGNAIAVWRRFNGANNIIQAARYDAGTSSWSSPDDLSAAGQSATQPQVALDSAGNAIAVWTRSNGAVNFIVQAAILDAAPPVISALSVPSSGLVGQTVTMSVAVEDPHGLGGTRWEFGDGAVLDVGSQPTTATQHAYTAPGTYTVTVTQRDAVGNESSASAQVVIAAPAVPAGAPAPTPAPVIRCAGRAATIVGTNRRDVIRGTPRADVIHSLGGNDVVRGLAGNDVICLGSGNDRGIGGGGADLILGQNGNDRTDGSAGNDRLLGGRGNDVMRGQNGNDRHVGGPGRDLALGGRGNDRLDGGGANDRLLGGPGRDVLLGRGGRDVLAGGSGRDLALGGSGNDRLFGNSAGDRLDGGRGRDLANGGGGSDRCIRAEIRRSC